MSAASRGVIARAWGRFKGLFGFWGQPIPAGSGRFRSVALILKATCLLAALHLVPYLFLTLTVVVLGVAAVVAVGLALAGLDVAGEGAFFLLLLFMFGVLFFGVFMAGLALAAVVLGVANGAYLRWVGREPGAGGRVRVVGLVLLFVAFSTGAPWAMLSLEKGMNWLAFSVGLLPAGLIGACALALFAFAGSSDERGSVTFEVARGG